MPESEAADFRNDSKVSVIHSSSSPRSIENQTGSKIHHAPNEDGITKRIRKAVARTDGGRTDGRRTETNFAPYADQIGIVF